MCASWQRCTCERLSGRKRPLRLNSVLVRSQPENKRPMGHHACLTILTDGWINQAYSRLSTTHGHITDCKLLVHGVARSADVWSSRAGHQEIIGFVLLDSKLLLNSRLIYMYVVYHPLGWGWDGMNLPPKTTCLERP